MNFFPEKVSLLEMGGMSVDVEDSVHQVGCDVMMKIATMAFDANHLRACSAFLLAVDRYLYRY